MRTPSSRHLTPSTALSLAISLVLVSAPFAVAAPQETPPSESPPTEKVVVEIVTENGSGCPRGTTTVNVEHDNTAFSLGFGDYRASAGAGSKPTDFRKSCQLVLAIHTPTGFTYAIPAVTYTGFAHLEKGASAQIRGTHYVAGMAEIQVVTHPFAGPFDDYWAVTDTDTSSYLPWMPCGELHYLNVNTELRVIAGTSDTATTSSYITRDALENQGSATYRLSWKRCP
ncbi:MAG: hypothetical protein QG622_679 [Actinomycetota bacterium]|nr:hypothetical protein [Actinomycetota bacterium]